MRPKIAVHPRELTEEEVLRMLAECKDPPPVKKPIFREKIVVSFL